MYDRSIHHRAHSYGYQPYGAAVTATHTREQHQPHTHQQQQSHQQSTQKHYPAAHSTSSAYSASANPNEDWTKISDLAERRRIQNRIAQRNYRKKLKKRLEDLERRAGSSSASPEQKHEELARPESSSPTEISSPYSGEHHSPTLSHSRHDHRSEATSQRYILPATEDRGMFSQQNVRQLSTSPPPPFSYPPLNTGESVGYGGYQPVHSYSAVYANNNATGVDGTLHQHHQYLPPMQHSYTVPSAPAVKSEYYDEEMSPFSMSYASMTGIDSTTQSFHDVAAYVSNTRTQPPPFPPRSHTYPQPWSTTKTG